MRRRSDSGFFGIALLLGVLVVSMIGAISVRHYTRYTLPEMQSIDDPAGPPWPRIPSGLRRPSAIQIGDTLAVSVKNNDDLTGEFVVDDGGDVHLPLLGPQPVAGRTVEAASAQLAAALAQGYLVDPHVAVTIVRSPARTIFVLGIVKSPGAVVTRDELSLANVLTLAGGVAPAASGTVLVTRLTDRVADVPTPVNDAHAQTLMFDLSSDGGVTLRDGDTIYVRAAGMIVVIGGVVNQGPYVFEPGMTVAQAIALSGGLREGGTTRGLRISRFVNGVRKDISAQPATMLTPGDVLRVRARMFSLEPVGWP